MNVNRWLATHRRSVLFLIAVAALGGVLAAWNLPVALFPKIDFPRVAVTVDSGDRPVDRMVVEVTRPLEQALRSVPDVAGIRSTSSRGSAELSVSFNWGIDMTAAQLQVESAIHSVVADLPARTRFEVRRMDPTVFPVLGLTLTSSTHDLAALRHLALYQLRPILSAVPDVAQVEVLGGDVMEYQIALEPARLREAGLSVDDVNRALTANNGANAVGRLEDRYRLYLTLTESRLRSLDDVRQLVIKATPRGAITLGHIAQVQMGHAPLWTRVTADGRDAVLINIRQSRGANAVNLTKAVRAQLAAHTAELPRDVKIGTFYDQSELVSAAAASVRDAILIGAVLAGIVLLLFLRNWRLTLLLAVVLPVVLAITAQLLSVFGMSLNIMTLGGMAAAVGLIVDDAVVMVEHMVRKQQEDSARRESSLLPAAQEMLRPLLGSSLATVVIFVPLAFLSGVTGGFFSALALTMACALTVSFLVALLAVPLLTDWLSHARQSEAASHQPQWFQRFSDRYAALAGAALRYPMRVLIAVAVLLILGGLAFWRLPSGFMPPMDEGGFILDYRAAPGTSLAETDRLLHQVEDLIRATPEVATYSRRTGLQLGGGLTEANEGDFFIKLKPPPRRDIEAVMTDLRQRIESQVPGLPIEILQLMEDLIGDLTAVPQPIEVKLFGADLARLQKLAPEVANKLHDIKGLVEIQDGLRVAGDALEVRVDRPRAALEGMDADGIAQQLSALIGGSVVGQIQSGEELLDIRLWSPQDLRTRIESLQDLQLAAADGHTFPLRRVADVRISTGQPQIVHENLEQMIAVTARLEGRDLGSAIKEVKKTVAGMNLPRSVRVDYGGLYAEQQRSFRGLAAVFAAAVLLVTALLLYLYEEWAVVLAILATILLSAAGVFIGLWVTGTELNISALMGLTMIVGIVAEIAVFYFSELAIQPRRDADSLVDAGRFRLRPILMTGSIAILALLPLALGLGTGSAMQTPLAIAIISGLVAALPLVLLVMPALYRALHTRR